MLKEMAEQALTPLLKTHRLRKRALTWTRREGGLFHVFNLQRSQWNDANREDFTINVGAGSSLAWEACWGKALPKYLKVDECCLLFRVGEILNDFAPLAVDKWWSLTNDLSDAERRTIQEEVVQATRDKCLPLLHELRTDSDLLGAFDRLPEAQRRRPVTRLYYAILHAHHGSKAEAERMLAEFEDPTLEAWRDRAVEVRTRLGLGVS